MQLEPGHWLHCAVLAWIFTWLTQQATGSWICEEFPTCRTLQFQKQAECHRQSACGYLWAPAMSACLESSESVWGCACRTEGRVFFPRWDSDIGYTCKDNFFSVKIYPIGHWIPLLNSLFSNATLSFDIHLSAQRNFYISTFSVLLAESHGQKKFLS